MAGSKTGTTAAAAKLVRADIKAAVKARTLGSYPAGITFSVRTRNASMMSAIDVSINGAPDDWKITGQRVSAEVIGLGGALSQIIARYFDDDGSIYFADIYLDDCICVPC
jgi:hypothetical protein